MDLFLFDVGFVENVNPTSTGFGVLVLSPRNMVNL